MEMYRFALAFLFLLTATECENLGKSAPSEDKCGIQRNATLYGALPFGRPVYGVQSLGNEIYVIRDSTPYIEVYDRSTFKPKRNITVPGMRGPYDMARSNVRQGFLFIADWFNSTYLFRVQVPQGTVSSWPIGETASTTLGLARANVYTNGDILVTSSASQTVKKFTVSGNQQGEFTVSAIPSPRQSIQVRPTNRHAPYAVCYGYGPPPALHRVCLVDGRGVIDKCYGNTRGSGPGQLNTPGRMELVKNSCILVADTGNQRVVALTRDLEYVRDLITGINSPYRLFFDETENLLYVAANKVNASGIAVYGRVVVYRL